MKKLMFLLVVLLSCCQYPIQVDKTFNMEGDRSLDGVGVLTCHNSDPANIKTESKKDAFNIGDEVNMVLFEDTPCEARFVKYTEAGYADGSYMTEFKSNLNENQTVHLNTTVKETITVKIRIN